MTYYECKCINCGYTEPYCNCKNPDYRAEIIPEGINEFGRTLE